MTSDIYMERVSIKDNFDDKIKAIARLQASRTIPRRLISVVSIKSELLLVFEVVD
jgi:hypothetical protein